MKYWRFIWGQSLAQTASHFVHLRIHSIGLHSLRPGIRGSTRAFAHIAASANPERIYASPRFAGKLLLAQMQQMTRLPYVSRVGGHLAQLSAYYGSPETGWPF